MNFTNIPNKVIIDIIKQIDLSKFIGLVTLYKDISYNIIITGSVGVGKSTVAQLIYEILKELYNNVKIYPEYINQTFNNIPIGSLMLDAKVNNLISADTFQNFVLDIWEHQLKNNEFKKNNTINILERLPEDAVTCFTKESYDNGNMSTLAWNNINHRLQLITEKYNVPSSMNCEFKLINNNGKLTETIQNIINVICDDIKNGVRNRLFGLIIDDEKYINRIIERGRLSELNTDLTIFKHYNEYYTKLYNKLKLNTL